MKRRSFVKTILAGMGIVATPAKAIEMTEEQEYKWVEVSKTFSIPKERMQTFDCGYLLDEPYQKHNKGS